MEDHQIYTLNQLKSLRRQIVEHLHYQSFEQICKQYKIICKKFAYYLINLLGSNQQFGSIFAECIQSLATITHSLNPKKYGQTFPHITYLLKQYQQKLKIKLPNPSARLIIQRIQQNQKSKLYETINLKMISQKQMQYFQQPNFNNSLDLITNNQIVLPNPSCVSCSPVFIDNICITNQNPLFNLIICLNQKQAFETANFQRYVCSVINSGGGVILIGAQSSSSGIISMGIKFKNRKEIQLKQKQWKTLISQSIKPKCNFSVQRVLLHNTFLNNETNEKVRNQILSVCFRVKVFPIVVKNVQMVSYIWTQLKGFHPVVEIYKLNQQKKPMKILYDQQTQCSFYNFIQNSYENRNKVKQNKKNSHKNVKCQYLNLQYSLFFKQYINKYPQAFQNFMEEKNEHKQQQEDQLFINHDNFVLVIIGSHKKDRFLKDLKGFMNTKKYAYQITKPFPNNFKDGARSILLFSYNQKYQVIKNAINQCDSTKSVSVMKITMMLQMEILATFNEEARNYISEQFYKKFPNRKFLLTQKNEGYVYQFNSTQQAIFAYMLFQSQNFRPTFVKKNIDINKKIKLI